MSDSMPPAIPAHHIRQPIVDPRHDHAVQAGNWWSRNWKWAVPAVVVTGMGAVVAFVVGLLMLVFTMIKSSDAYTQAVAKANANRGVVEALGTPIEEGFFVTGSISTSEQSGSADLAIPLSGPNGAATVWVEATKSAGGWTYRTLIVEIHETGERIDLTTAGS